MSIDDDKLPTADGLVHTRHLVNGLRLGGRACLVACCARMELPSPGIVHHVTASPLIGGRGDDARGRVDAIALFVGESTSTVAADNGF